MNKTLLTSSEAARRLGRSADRVRQLADQGKLTAIRTRSGMRLFREFDVERFAEECRRPKGGSR